MTIKVDSKHPDYEENIEIWARCRDTIEGSDSIKNAKRKYLPSLEKQTTTDYDAYVERALFYGGTSRTVQGLLGAAFRKDPVINFPKNIDEVLSSITSKGISVENLARRTVKEILSVGRTGLLVDVDDSEKVYAELYKTENIINWSTERIDGKEELTMIVLKEIYFDIENQFEQVRKEQIRVLWLTRGISPGEQSTGTAEYVYWQQLYRKGLNNDSEEWMLFGEAIVPLRKGIKLNRIPFVFVNTNNMIHGIEKPPLLDMIDVNLSHYRTSADLEHGAHYTALPTAWIAGFKAENNNFVLGSRTAWVSSNENAKAGFLEFTGQGLGALSDLKKDKESMMAILGARMLEEQKKSTEATDTHKVRLSGETGALSVIVSNAGEALEYVLRTIAWWRGFGESVDSNTDITVELNDDFIDSRMNPQELTAMMKTWQAGGMSQQTFLYNLKRGELLEPDVSVEDEMERIDNELGGGVTGSEDVISVKRNFDLVKDEDGNTTGIKEV